MSKIFFVVILVLGLGGYFLINSKKGSEVVQDDVSTVGINETIPDTSAKKMAFAEFVKQGGSYQCTISQYVSDTDTKGVVYLDGGMIRGEYNTVAQGMSIDSTLIVRDGYTYSWTSMVPSVGFKAKTATDNKTDGELEAAGSYSFNAEQIGDYDCQAWSSDPTKFIIPANITFQEVSA